MIFIAIQSGHNATVGLSINGEIVSVISEERITRIKNYEGFPAESLRFIKSNYLNNDLNKVDKFIVIDETGQTLNFVNSKIKNNNRNLDNKKNKKNLNMEIISLLFYHIFPKSLSKCFAKIKKKIKNKNLNYKNRKNILLKLFNFYPDLTFDLNKIEYYNHHEMHALSFCYFSDDLKKKSLVFTMDGEGDDLSSSVSIFADETINKISQNSSLYSVGYLYSQVTAYLGLKPFEHEFKVMGMAPYGKKEDVDRIYKKIKHLLIMDKDGNFMSNVVSNLFKYEISKYFLYEKFQNICGAIQKMTEKLIIDWITFWVKKKSIKNIIVSGGVFMNIKACKELLDLKIIDSLFVVPSATDDSLIFGALWKANKINKVKTKKINNLYIGRTFEKEVDKFIDKIVDDNNNKISNFNNYLKLNEYAAELLNNNAIIGRCCGKEEWGARALGNRSIICNPSKLENIRLINSTIKERDYWMPFSPTILDEDEEKYFYNKKNFEGSFMTCLFDSTDIAKKDLICAIHPIDFTLRPQVLKETQNPKYYDLIKKFKAKSNIGAVLNTSFNLHGYPNVSSHEDAFFTFKKSNLKYLIIENFLIEKIN